jgi:hypothetical protein
MMGKICTYSLKGWMGLLGEDCTPAGLLFTRKHKWGQKANEGGGMRKKGGGGRREEEGRGRRRSRW